MENLRHLTEDLIHYQADKGGGEGGSGRNRFVSEHWQDDWDPEEAKGGKPQKPVIPSTTISTQQSGSNAFTPAHWAEDWGPTSSIVDKPSRKSSSKRSSR